VNRRPLVVALAILAAACFNGQRPTANRQPFEDSPDEAARYFAQKRGITADLDINARYAAAREQILRMPQRCIACDDGSGRIRATSTRGWQFLGPGNVGGRTRALLIDPHHSNVMYAGAVSGGVWKTTDGGASWATMTDFLPNIAVNSLAFDPADSSVIYAGTGEGYFREVIRNTNVPIRGNGISVTRDAGATWQQLPSTAGEDFYWVNDLVVSTHDSRRIYAATRNGVFRSLDGGESWTRVVATDVTGGCTDLALRADAANDFVFAACGMLEDQATVYRSTNAEGDGAWTPVLSQPDMGRTTLAIAPSDSSVVYALAARNGGVFDQGLFAVFRSADGGATWTAQVQTQQSPSTYGALLLTNVYSATTNDCARTSTADLSNMGWHSNVIAVDPMDPNRVWAAGVDLFRSDDGGKKWGVASYWWAAENKPSYVHADQHAIVFDPHYDGAANQSMLVTNDGGVFRTDNARAAVSTRLVDYCTPDSSQVVFHPLNHDFGATQFYHGAVFPGGERYFGGAQDNSTPMGSDAQGVNGWTMEFAGDGGYVAVDPVDPTVIYGEAQRAQIVKAVNLHVTASLAPPDGDYLFVAPFMLDPNQHDRLWLGGGFTLMRRDVNRNYVDMTTRLDGHVTAMDVAPGNSNRILVATESGTIYRNDAALSASRTTAWKSAKPRDGWVSSLIFDPSNTNVAYATYANFGGGAHVWKTIDAGATWTPLDGASIGALPDIPIHSLVLGAGGIYLGTDLGIFLSTDGGDLWFADSSFPRAITEKLVLASTPRGLALFAFTHGRGAWRADLFGTSRRRGVSH
jgi:hypothetical protein